jgi:hypothetical protein
MKHSSPIWICTIIFAALFAGVVSLQFAAGAYGSEFSQFPDEPSHYINGLLIHDYLLAGLPGNPLTYAENYYRHYPKVALGVWPPGFYVFEALWLMVFPLGKASVLVWMALQTTALAFLAGWAVARHHGAWGWLVAPFVPVLWYVQYGTAIILTDVFVALFGLLAMFAWSRYAETEKTSDALWFGLFTSIAILGKASGISVIWLPPAFILLTRRWNLLKRPGLYWAALIVVVLAGPATLYSYRKLAAVNATVPWQPSFFADYFSYLVENLGWPVLMVAICGLGWRLWRPSLSVFTQAAIFALGTYVFHASLPHAPENRYIMTALVPMLILAADMLFRLGRPGLWAAPVLAILLCAQNYRLVPMAQRGFQKAASSIAAMQPAGSTVVLIASDGYGEGALVAELASLEKRPGRYIVRGSKLLSDQDWISSDYKSYFDSPETLGKALREASIELLVLDYNPGDRIWKHLQLLEELMAKQSGQWQLLEEIHASPDLSRGQRRIRIYRQNGVIAEPAAIEKMRFNMRSLGQKI